MARILQNPNALRSNDIPDTDLRNALVSIWYLVEEFNSTQTLDYSLNHIPNEHVFMNNPLAATVLFDDNPLDGQKVSIHIGGGRVTADFNGKNVATVEGDQICLELTVKGETYDFQYFDIHNNGDENGADIWVIS